LSGPLVATGEVRRFAAEILEAAGMAPTHADVVADHCVWADTGGRPNYGVWRLPILVKRIESGMFELERDPVVERRGPSMSVVDGANVIGHVAAVTAMETALDLARSSGVGAVAVHDSNYMGALGYYVDRMARSGIVALVTSNSHPRVAAHGGTTPVLGTDPLAFGAPLASGRTLIIDLATSATAGGLITRSTELGLPLPEGVAVDRDGAPITDAAKVGAGALLPLGGAKGFALALMVEVLAGVLTGAGISHGVRSQYKDFERPGNSGHMFLGIDPARLMEPDLFAERMASLVESVTVDGGVRLPGQARWEAWAEAEERGGVEVSPSTLDALAELAARYGVEAPRTGLADVDRGNE
jgi:ureidoglycolate dehydrogenase (NAD+)